MENNRKISIQKLIVSIIAIIFIITHLIRPDLAIDAIVVGLLVIALIPWLSDIFKFIELPGGFKFEFKDKEKIEEKIIEAGLISPETEESFEFSFQQLENSDPNLALAGLRIEIETRLKEIAQKNNISGSERMGAGQLLRLLREYEILNSQERSVLGDLIGLLNEAIHGKKINQNFVNWAMDIGPEILKSLDDKYLN